MAMASLPWLPVIGWLVSPIIIFFMNKFLSYLDFHLSTKLDELKSTIIPSLEKILGDVTEHRMLRGAKDVGKRSESDLKTLGDLEKRIKFELYDIVDFMDLIQYRRNEKKVISGDGKSVGTSISSWVLLAIGDCIACCKRSSFGQKLWQCAENQNQKLRDIRDKLQQWVLDLDLKFWDLVAKLQQCTQNLHRMFRDLLAKLQQCVQDLNLKFRDLVAKLQQYAQSAQYLHRNRIFRDHALRATLVQCAQTLNKYTHQGAAGQPSMHEDAPAAEFKDDIEQGSATPSSTPDVAPSNPPTPNAFPNPARSATEFRGDNHHGSAEEASSDSFVQMICDWLVYGFSAIYSFYLGARDLRDKSYEPFGIKNDDGTAIDCVLSIHEMISLRKKIKNIEHIVSESEKSPLLNKSSSTTTKDANKESRRNCTVKNNAEESTSTHKEIDDMYRIIEKKVFGRDTDREHISRMLRDGPDAVAASSSTSKPYSVIGIHGIPGSGKTTLAQYVCDYEKEAGHFDPIMFIDVRKTFTVDGIFRDMLEQMTHSRPPNEEGPKSLKTKLEQTLKGKRFLLVVDDLWVNDGNDEEWDILLDTLRAALRGSRVLVTSQKTDAAAALGAQEQISIPDLEEGIYLSLFMHHARPDASDDDGEYDRIGRKIANRLGRSPIAAVTVGKQLQRNKSISFWETTANLDVLNKTMGALWWSYQQLGVDVRRCFTYCIIFPKGYGIGRDEMVRMWVAQGFVSDETEEPEDVGQRYFDELLTFSFLAERKNSFMRFTIHDLLHELAERVSGSEFYRIGLNGLPKDNPQGVHHLFIETNNVAEIVEEILDLGNLRTLIINERSYDERPYDQRVVTTEKNHDLEKFLGRLFMRLRKLRVLIFRRNYRIYKLSVSVPASIYHMKHLRYLCFVFHVPHLILPSTFNKLYHIQSTDIADASYPEGMANLICFRHIPDRLSCSIPNIGRLTSLQRLPSFEVKQGQGYELKQLMHLNKLRGNLSIQGLEFVGSKQEALEAQLNHKERLRRLELNFGSSKRFGPHVEAEVLEGLCPPKDLDELHIKDYRGSRYPSWMLGPEDSKFLIGLDAPKQLHKLELKCCSKLPSIIPKDSKLLIGLRELTIFNCDWDSLPENMECLLSLQTMEICFCHYMKLLPKLPVQSLKVIRIVGCHVLSRTCQEKGHEDWHKIKDIPDKLIVMANMNLWQI